VGMLMAIADPRLALGAEGNSSWRVRASAATYAGSSIIGSATTTRRPGRERTQHSLGLGSCGDQRSMRHSYRIGIRPLEGMFRGTPPVA
jgi:hypothetical protein